MTVVVVAPTEVVPVVVDGPGLAADPPACDSDAEDSPDDDELDDDDAPAPESPESAQATPGPARMAVPTPERHCQPADPTDVSRSAH